MPFHAVEKVLHHRKSARAYDGMLRRANGEENVVEKSMRRRRKAREWGIT